ncbi:MAG: cytochrome P450 [Bacteroidota bacterium]
MPPVLFLQSDVQDPYAGYAGMLRENPVYWDDKNKLWAVYSYKGCVSILTNPAAHIPSINQNNKDGLNEYALLIAGHVARLSNNIQHTIAREIAMLLFQNVKNISIKSIADKLLQDQNNPAETDFVHSICKRLPVMVVLKSFDFDDKAVDFICGRMERLVNIMLVVKTAEQVKHINEVAGEIYVITEKHILATGIHRSIIKLLNGKYGVGPGELIAACICNLVGLFIQAYDAGRGVLSNTLLQILTNDTTELNITDKVFIEKWVIETLRFNPPVQNTRRIAAENILLDNAEIKQGESILVVLAAANRDPETFNLPTVFDIKRSNNAEHLTFGFGHHQCVAKQFSVYMATETLAYFFYRYKIKLVERVIEYEPLVNVRLPREILISLA